MKPAQDKPLSIYSNFTAGFILAYGCVSVCSSISLRRRYDTVPKTPCGLSVNLYWIFLYTVVQILSEAQTIFGKKSSQLTDTPD